MTDSSPNQPPAPGASSGISVLIRTFNSARTLPEVIGNLGLTQADELLVVDSGSTDTTLEIAGRSGARIIKFEGPFNYSRSLNIGFAAARNPWLLVLSSHCIPLRPDYVPYLRQQIAGFPAKVAVAYGPNVLTAGALPSPTPGAPRYWDWSEWERQKQSLGGNINAVYRCDCWRQHPFNEDLITAEDLEWCIWALRNGYEAAQLPQAVVLYRNLGRLKHMFAKGVNEARLAGQMLGPQPLTPRGLAIGIGSLMKKLLLFQLPPGIFLRQCIFLSGVFIGSRSAGKRQSRGAPSTASRS